MLQLYPVNVALVQENEEHNIVSEASDAVHGGHFDDECKDVIDECIQGFVGHHSPRKMGHGFQPTKNGVLELGVYQIS